MGSLFSIPENPLIVICGPTSTGKTSLALSLCRKFKGEIISADSRQVYRFMDVGTGKLPVTESNVQIKKGNGMWEIGGIRVWLYDVVNPNQSFTVVDYARRAEAEIKSCWRRGRVPFLVGGSGFYIDVVLGKLTVAGVPPDFELRRELEKLSTAELFEKLQALDPQRAKTIDPANPHRLIRAVEIAVSRRGGSSALPEESPAAQFPNVARDKSLKLNAFILGLTAPRGVLYARADRWAQAIISNGTLIDEIYDLLDRGYRNTPPLRGIVYKTVLEFVDQKITKGEMLQKIKFDLHGYIRRQLTWFRRDEGIRWFDITQKGFDKRISDAIRWKLKP